jgi:hypothetical protein
VVREAVNKDDGCQSAEVPQIRCKVKAGVMDRLVTLVGEECGSGCEKPPIRIRVGVIDGPDGSGGGEAAKGHHPEDHGGKSRCPHIRRRGCSERWGSKPEGVRVLPLTPAAGGGSCNKVSPRPTSRHPEKKQQTIQLPMSTLDADKGNVLVGGDLPEGVVFVIPKVNLDPPGTGPGKIERCGEEDTRVKDEEPEVQDKAPNTDAAIRGNVELPPPWQRPPHCRARCGGQRIPQEIDRVMAGGMTMRQSPPPLDERRSPPAEWWKKFKNWGFSQQSANKQGGLGHEGS